MPMTPNSFGPPGAPPHPPPPGHHPYGPPGPPAPPPAAHGRRRWPTLVVSGAIGALVAAAVAAVVTTEVREDSAASAIEPSPSTTTVAAPPPPSAAPVPTRQADERTCREGWIPAGNLAASAVTALRTLPDGVRVGDTRIPSNPAWAEAVERAGDSYRRAGDVLAAHITPGATPILRESAEAAAKSLTLLGNALIAGDPVNGNAGEMVDAAGAQVGALCQRLAR